MISIDMELDHKKCPDCQEILPLEAFALDRSNKSGRGCRCRECHNTRQNKNKKLRRAGRPSKRSGTTRLEAIENLLSDRQWHSTEEVRAIGGIGSLNRIGDLRRRGLLIAKKRDYGATYGWKYRLVDSQEEYEALSVDSPRELLLDILRDGKWHSNEELFDRLSVTYQDHLFFLRQEGFVVRKTRDPECGTWHYKLEV